MALVSPPVCDFGWKAVDFDLTATDNKSYTLENVKGPNGTLIMFICNHCPYVTSVIESIVNECIEIQKLGVGIAAVCSNDAKNYPADSFENMVKFAKTHRFSFPYLHDKSQKTGRAYDAQCTPDFFGFNASDELHYRGRLGKEERDLFNAMQMIANTGSGPENQTASMGCSIKWTSM